MASVIARLRPPAGTARRACSPGTPPRARSGSGCCRPSREHDRPQPEPVLTRAVDQVPQAARLALARAGRPLPRGSSGRCVGQTGLGRHHAGRRGAARAEPRRCRADEIAVADRPPSVISVAVHSRAAIRLRPLEPLAQQPHRGPQARGGGAAQAHGEHAPQAVGPHRGAGHRRAPRSPGGEPRTQLLGQAPTGPAQPCVHHQRLGEARRTACTAAGDEGTSVPRARRAPGRAVAARPPSWPARPRPETAARVWHAAGSRAGRCASSPSRRRQLRPVVEPQAIDRQ